MKIFKGTLEECNAAISNLNSALNYPNDKGTLRAATPKQKEETETYCSK